MFLEVFKVTLLLTREIHSFQRGIFLFTLIFQQGLCVQLGCPFSFLKASLMERMAFCLQSEGIR